MSISTPILAAIIGSIVAGVTSLVINLISLFGQYKLTQRNKRWMTRFHWKRETISIVRELRREATGMDLDEYDQETFDRLHSELEKQTHSIPQKYRGSDINSALDDITLCHTRFDPDSPDSSLPAHRQSLIEKSEDFIDKINSGPNGGENSFLSQTFGHLHRR
ncbi:hypothetical protein [Salinarchaeum laminariae]|uniref:hypothetical protein n=1 Tax=Salinarchaeum laminariae TaxID=869888 RepID=UPI0020C03C13|nr:hypothetical protein [Salinarchaeum laminariae]